jgi:hypothetical protein
MLRFARRVMWVLGLALGGTAAAAEVNVLTAWYGQSCGAAHGNVTSHVKSRCDGKSACQYVVDAGILGDPAPRCTKNLIVMFSCGNQADVRLAQLPAEANGKTLALACGQ